MKTKGMRVGILTSGGEWNSLKSEALYMLVRDLLKKKVPVHGIGFQCHWELDRIPSAVSIRKTFQRFTDLGLDIAVTEADIRYKGEVTEERQKKQAKGYAMLLRTALSFTNFREIVFWGITDKYSWIPYFFLEYGNALLFDGNYYEKPAYEAVAEVLRGTTK